MFQAQVSTLAGSGVSGSADGPADQAQFDFPVGIAVDPKGRIYIADPRSHRIRVFTPAN
ncbi:MAG: hypothetical protein JRH20_22920 [Deltaproteobacteria bacterium]|nr:hypothetical protein [Deltaproteobacteria bacterium]